MSRTRQATDARIALVGLGAVLAALLVAPPAFAQTEIGGASQPSVEINLDVLRDLVPDNGTAASDAASGGSVLLLPPSTAPAQDFVFPVLPETKPEAPPQAAAPAPPPEPEPAATLAQPEPEAAPEPVAVEPPAELAAVEPPPEPAPEPVEAAAGDPFAAEAPEPQDIQVPEPASELESVIAAMPSDPAPEVESLRILFAPGTDELTEADRAALRRFAQDLVGNAHQRIQLRAYASSEDGTSSAARRLALARALAVRAFLIENNVRSTRIDVRALGDRLEGDEPADRIDIVPVGS